MDDETFEEIIAVIYVVVVICAAVWLIHFIDSLI